MKLTPLLLAAAAFAGFAAAFDRSNNPSPEPQPRPLTPPPPTPMPDQILGGGRGGRGRRSIEQRSEHLLARDLFDLQARQAEIYAELDARNAELADGYYNF